MQQIYTAYKPSLLQFSFTVCVFEVFFLNDITFQILLSIYLWIQKEIYHEKEVKPIPGLEDIFPECKKCWKTASYKLPLS